ncbi:hypothetical protein LTR95_011726 [Oleoguttula sp. CCFEE 5521]
MRNQTWTLPQHATCAPDGSQMTYYTLSKHIASLQPWWLATHRPLPSTLQTMLTALHTGVTTATDSPLFEAAIVLPLNPSGDLTSRFDTAAQALGLSHFGNCSSPAQGSLVVDYSPAGLLATKVVDGCGTIEAVQTWHDDPAFLPAPHTTTLGSGTVNVSSLREFVNAPVMQPYTADDLVGIDKIILTGSLGNTTELREILKSALTGGPYEGKLDEMLVLQQGALAPLFVVSASAAKASLDNQQDLWVVD